MTGLSRRSTYSLAWVVSNPNISSALAKSHRNAGGAVLGGSYQKHDWNGEVDHELAKRIMKRAVELCPSLTGGKGPEGLDVIKHCVGLRPLREGGTRLEKEKIDDFWVVHNYAHGGFGCTSYSFRKDMLANHPLNRSMLLWLFSRCCGYCQGYLEHKGDDAKRNLGG